MTKLCGPGLAVEESQDEHNYQQSAERKHASSYGSQAFNLGGGMDWKYKINDVMGKYEPQYKGGRMQEVCKGLDLDV